MILAGLVTYVILLATSSSDVAAATSSVRTVGFKSARHARVTEPSFSLSQSFPSIFLGDQHMNNPTHQAALRAKLNMVLDTVEAHYSGALHRVHELWEPKVASILQDLLLLVPYKPTGDSSSSSSRSLHADATTADADAIHVRRRRLSGTKATAPYRPPKRLPSPLSALPSPSSLTEWSLQVGTRLAQLPAGISFPVLRRLLAAVVVRAWLDGAGERLTEEEEEAVSGVFVQLYMLHRRGAMNRGIMGYQHVSKSGGTSWCHAAELNGCVTQHFDRFYVCGVSSFEDKVRWVDGAAHKRLTGGEPTRWSLHGVYRSTAAPDCASRAAQMLANRWTYYSNEYTLTGGEKSLEDVDVCSKQFVTSILFRDPIRRLSSHLRFLLLHYKRFMTAQVEEATGPAADFFKTYAGAAASFWSSVAPAITDNYFARTLLGEATWHASVGSISVTQHLPAARLVLMQYDIVVPLESPTEMTSRLLAFGAGWPVSYTDVHDKNITALQELFDFDPTPHMPTRDQLELLNRRQAVDVQLYELAVLLGQLDYLVYGTAAAAGVVPWEGMPTSVDPADETASFRVACGLLRGPGGAWSAQMVHRRRRAGSDREGAGRGWRRSESAAAAEGTRGD